MSTKPQIQYSGPTVSDKVDFEVRRHLQLMYQKLTNHTQAFSDQTAQIKALQAEIAALKST